MINLIDIYKIYPMGDEELHALDGINLEIQENEFVAIVGQSGSGKSTCMNIIGFLDTPTSGQYLLSGEDVSYMSDDEQAYLRNSSLGFIFQQYNLIQKLTVYENVELPLVYRGIHERDRRDMVEDALERVGIAEKHKNLPNQLSGGQQQRASIARALVGRPKIILADEPTGALDSKTGIEMLEFLGQLNEEGNTLILITHDMEVARRAKRLIRLYDGRIVEDTEVAH
ncbi:MAG: ABC transporter ATP-binding protein [Clostridiales Family XIII bacterium]|nr:ABC transporter ATP-binding protein [Clostridiales Family XIII bacterium]